ncbi:hypothetical protein [Massilia endophytica]|uniref:hypothetical protein n=1 Tax=Massilia endophytica TaxID=2899220 RepID=UPI001E5CDEFC|nr:hypothetical protein [Massilia endophytica]UGQ46382.1 hypothetical protein LSQ66_21880 [Massilia endophytica]
MSSTEVLMEWLGQYEHIPNTYRTYFREFERLQTWLLLEELDFLNVDTSDLARYLDEFSSGLLHPKLERDQQPTQLSERTVRSTRNTLVRLFAVLSVAGLRTDNPATSLSVPRTVDPDEIDPRQLLQAAKRWHEIRESWTKLPDPERGSRDPLWRTIVVAEWSYWTALHRSELASARMSDIRQTAVGWQTSVHRFGRGDVVDNVFVPAPAIEALRRYRISRGLSPAPRSSETDVPLIAKLRTDDAVMPWTIGHILRDASQYAESVNAHEIGSSDLSNRALRRYLIAHSLQKRIPYQDLVAHVRSHYAVDIHSRAPGSTISTSLAALESD